MSAVASEAVAGEVVQAEDLRDVNNAVARFDTVAAGVAALQKQYGGVVYDVTAPKGMEAAKEARRAIREPRYEIEKVRKAAKAPILALGRRIDGEAERITKQLLAIEEPIDQQIKTEEARKEAERQAAIEAERQRLAAIDRQIDAMRAAPAEVAGKSADIIRARLDALYEPTDFDFQERVDIAKSVRADVIARLETMLTEREAFEAEQLRLAEEREAEAERRRQEEARLEQERQRLAAERAEQERKAAEERDRLRREQEQREKEESERQARIREDEERLARQRRELEQERAANNVHANITRIASDALAANTIAAVDEALALLPVYLHDSDYGAERAEALRALRDERQRELQARLERLTFEHAEAARRASEVSSPPPAAAGELTSTAVPSPPAVDPATPAAGAVSPYPYPGHQALVDCIAVHLNVPTEAARQWLAIYAEANLPDEAVL